jgi:hypothetical protein
MMASTAVSKSPRNPLVYLGFEAEGSEGGAGQGLPITIDLHQIPPHPFHREPIFVCVDVEGSYTFQNLNTEWGISLLDTRDLGPRQKPRVTPAAAPGDRGSNWFRFIRTRHFIVDDNLNYDKQHGRWLGKGDVGAFAFGKSKHIRSTEVQRTLVDYLNNVKCRNLRSGEQARYIIMVTWASRMEEEQTAREGVDWFNEADECWDVQKMRFARRLAINLQKPDRKVNIEQLTHWLGLGVPTQLLHNGGNDAAFELESMLAGLLLTSEQYSDLGLEVPTSLPRNWQGQTLDGNWRR